MDETNAPPYRKQVAANVAAALARAGRTRAGLALALNHDPAWSTRRLKSQTSFTVDDLAEIAAELGVPISSLTQEAEA
jgi:hypothetical protein